MSDPDGDHSLMGVGGEGKGGTRTRACGHRAIAVSVDGQLDMHCRGFLHLGKTAVLFMGE